MSLLHDARFSSWARGHLLCRVEDVADRFALTFDDGPNGRATAEVLDRLAGYGATATFFLLGRNVRRHPGLVQRLKEAGNEAAVHGDGHWPLPLSTPWGIRNGIERAAAAIHAAAGPPTRFYRPPFGFMTPGQAQFVRGLGFEPVLGDVYPEDPHQRNAADIVRRVVPRLRAGSILILHDGSPFGDADRRPTVEALDPILSAAAASGLRAVTLGDLLAARPAGDVPR